MVFFVTSPWLLLLRAINDWFWYFFTSNGFIIQNQYILSPITLPQESGMLGFIQFLVIDRWCKQSANNRQFQMQISDIASPTYSVASNVLRLNASSVATSTPTCDLELPLVQFQEFTQPATHLPARPLPKKRLTIDIQEIYDFEQLQNKPNEEKGQQERQSRRDEGEPRREDGRRSEERQTRRSEATERQTGERQTAELMRLRETVETQRVRIDGLQREREYLLKENEQLRQMVAKKDDMLEIRQCALEEFSQKLAQVEAEVTQGRHYDEKLKEKEAKYRQLKKEYEKITAINRTLQRELRDTERKVTDLEKETQPSVYPHIEPLQKTKESSIKLKESSLKLMNPNPNPNKENTLANTVKSLDKKKPVTQPKKTARTATGTVTSNLNFVKKLQLKNTLY